MKETLLFIHGWATDNWVWEGLIEELYRGNVILNPNLPGHGGKGNWDEPTLKPAVKEVLKEVSGAAESSVIGIGWSLGAEVLLNSYEAIKNKLKGLILIGATPCFVEKEDFPWGQSKALVKRMIMDMKKDPAETVKRFYGLNFTASELAAEGAKGLMERYRYPGPVDCSGPVPGCFPLFKYREITTALEALCNTDLRSSLDPIDIPVLVIHGEKDAVVPLGAGEYLSKKIRGARFEVFKEAGHAPFITEPERFASVVKDFTGKL